jgi:hypothetical protein
MVVQERGEMMMLDDGFIPGGIEWSGGGINHSAPTLRDQFAMAALTGLCANPDYKANKDKFAVTAYELADAMLAARGGK